MVSDKAARIDLLSLSAPQMRASHLKWLAFFVCFFAYALGWIVLASAACAAVVRFSVHREQDEQRLNDQAAAQQAGGTSGLAGAS